jgi:ATP-dependent protease ClpP protease subunit
MKCIVYYRKEFETSMNKKPIVALMYDFDKTLSPKDMQEYGFISELGMKSEDF